MKKFLVILVATITLISLYVTPILGMEESVVNETIIKETDIETNKADDTFYLQAGVEEILNIDTNVQEDVEEVEDISTDETIYTGWSTAIVNIRKRPTTNSDIHDVLEYNQKIEYQLYNDKWVRIDYNGTSAYVAKRYISNNENKYKEYVVPKNSGFKSYMSYAAITNKASKQYKLQRNYAYTGNNGIRMVHDRYCIALGTHFNAPIGTYVDLILENGTTIQCIVAEIKSDQHTNADNIVTTHNGCVAEFIVDMSVLNSDAKRDGDVSSCKKEWGSPVAKLKVYTKSIF